VIVITVLKVYRQKCNSSVVVPAPVFRSSASRQRGRETNSDSALLSQSAVEAFDENIVYSRLPGRLNSSGSESGVHNPKPRKFLSLLTKTRLQP